MFIKKLINLFSQNYTHIGEYYKISLNLSYPIPDFSLKILKNQKLNQREKDLLKFIKKIKKKNLTILDVGAGYINIKNIIEKKTKKKIKLFVKETNGFTKKLEDIKKINEKIINYELVTNLKYLKKNNFDIIYFGSSFQYFLNVDKVLKDIQRINAKFVCIFGSNFFLSDRKSCIVKQVNMENDIFQRFHSINELQRKFLNKNYELIFKKPKKKDISIKHNIFNFEEFKIFDLIFKKK